MPRLAKSEATQNSRAAPATRNDTSETPSMPCVMASLPKGCHEPPDGLGREHAGMGHQWFFMLSISAMTFQKNNAKLQIKRTQGSQVSTKIAIFAT
jgi:hypothetical protein